MIPVFILSRISSERLPGKCFMDIGGMSLIDHVIERCRFYGMNPIVCVPLKDSSLMTPHIKCEMFHGSDDVEERISEANRSYKFESYHVLDGDDPYFDPILIEQGHLLAQGSHASAIAKPPFFSEAGAGLCGTHYCKRGEGKRHAICTDYEWFQRLTVDYQEDIEMMHALYRMGCNYMTPRSVVNDIFRRNPDLYKINWFRTEEWKARQNRERHGN